MSRFTFMTINFLLFHTCWMATAYGAGYGWDWLGPTFILPSLFIHLALIGYWIREGLFLLVAATFGYSINSLCYFLGLINYSTSNSELYLAPYWMFFLWLIFASLFHGSLQWLRDRFLTQIVLGLVVGPFAYLSAEVLGALTIGGDSSITLPILSLVWGIIIPFLSWLAFDVSYFSTIQHTGVSYQRNTEPVS
ncbi:MAG: DUF2878 domain-containing protein [bacterium]